MLCVNVTLTHRGSHLSMNCLAENTAGAAERPPIPNRMRTVGAAEKNHERTHALQKIALLNCGRWRIADLPGNCYFYRKLMRISVDHLLDPSRLFQLP